MSEKEPIKNPLLNLPHEGVLVDGEPFYKQVFEGIIGEIESMSEQEAVLVHLGKLSDLIPSEFFEGSISATSRNAEESYTPEELQQAVERLSQSYVPVTKGAGIRCVEDRHEQDYDDSNPSSYELGPQVQGGTPDIAIAINALAHGAMALDTLEKDVDATIEKMSSDFAPSGHTDTDNLDEGQMGCGALKRQEDKLVYYADPAKMNAIKSVVSAIYSKVGAKLPEGALDNLPINASKLLGIADTYFARKANIIDYITQKYNPNAKKVVTGKHLAAMVAINFMPSTTLNTGKFNLPTDGRIKSFGLDAWFIAQEFGDEAPYVFVDALATLMSLTDGTLDVYLRLPKEESVATTE